MRVLKTQKIEYIKQIHTIFFQKILNLVFYKHKKTIR
jgi:hypothetical protein